MNKTQLDKTLGTIKNYVDTTTKPKRILEKSGTSGKTGFIAMAKIVITGTYVNRPIEFKFIQRGRQTPCTVSIEFSNSDSTDPGLSSLKYMGTDFGVFIHKTAASTWLLYVTKSEAYDAVTLVENNTAPQGVTITYPGTFIEKKPTNTTNNPVVNASLGYTVGTAATCSGNAATATKLATARTINGTSFDGSANITTANWGTARTLTIGNKAQSVNGSGNVTWSLADIGAAAKSHTHNYAGSSSAGGAANSAAKLTTARTLTIGSKGKTFDGSANVSWTLAEIGAAASSHSHDYITYKDTRAVNEKPDDVQQGLSMHLKTSGTDGLSDGGGYHPSIHIKPWNDHSGGPYAELALTQNQNLWFRTSSSGTAWNSWKKVSIDGHTHSYLPLAGGTMTGSITLNNNLVVRGKKKDGNTLNLIQVGDDNRVYLGSENGATYIKGTTTEIDNDTTIHGNLFTNDGVVDLHNNGGHIVMSPTEKGTLRIGSNDYTGDFSISLRNDAVTFYSKNLPINSHSTINAINLQVGGKNVFHEGYAPRPSQVAGDINVKNTGNNTASTALPNSFLIQAGRVHILGNSTSVRVSFPNIFNNYCMSVVISPNGSTSDEAIICDSFGTYNVDTTGFNIRANKTNIGYGVNFYWMAFGW